MNKANTSDTKAPFWIYILSISSGFVSSKLYYKRDDFIFDIVNFPFLFFDVPNRPSYGVYISQLIRFGLNNILFDNKHSKYTERQKYCTTSSFDFFLIKTDDLRNQYSLLFMPVQKTIVAEKSKVCLKSSLHFFCE